MQLVVDIGNTHCKAALTDRGGIVGHRRAERFTPQLLEALLEGQDVERAIVSSTRDEPVEVLSLLRERGIETLHFTPQTPVPLRIEYRTPETLGRDRVAAAVGAAVLLPGRDVLVVDFGTAVTIDLVTASGVFRGGFISPGVGMRFRALHDYTARLPLCSPTLEVLEAGDSTASAIEQGVMQGLAYEIEGHIGRMKEKIGDLEVIFTGGDAKFFVKRIKNTIFANCDLVFCGLNRILEYNASEKTDR